MLLLSLIGFVAMSALLGRYMARRFVTPIVALSTAVAERHPDLPLLGSDDELGILARAFAAHTRELHDILERERAFTGDVSHELRTPLTVITGAAELLMLDHQANAAAHAASERIYRAASEAAESVSILLLLARSPELIEAEQFTLAPLLDDEVARHRPLVAAKPVTLSWHGGADFTVAASRRLVAAAIGNLIRNACLYTDQGSVSIAIAGRSVAVRDTGRGLPPAVLAMLAADSGAAPLRGSEGTGLGLALVKRICRQVNATLTVTPQADGGTMFALTFPAI